MRTRKPLHLEPLVLRGGYLQLEPLAATHTDELCAAGADPAIWTWYPRPADTADGMRAFVEQGLAMQRGGQALVFVQRRLADRAVMGSTRLVITSAPDYRAEIGWTWLNPRHQRSAANTEAKYLLLRHAFETLDLLRVEFKTDALNQASRRALARIGAQEEGTHRSHMITATGRIRDSVYFSIVDSDWPRVRQGLERKLAAPPPA